jgi:hypothetical protein
MDRRAFVTGLGTVLAAPLVTQAQHAGKVYLRAAVRLPREGWGRSMPGAPCTNRSLDASVCRRRPRCEAPVVNDKEEL